MTCNNKCCNCSCLEEKVEANLNVKEWRPLRYLDMVETKQEFVVNIPKSWIESDFSIGYLSHYLIRFFKFSPPKNKLVYVR
jgi:hypothetical protein